MSGIVLTLDLEDRSKHADKYPKTKDVSKTSACFWRCGINHVTKLAPLSENYIMIKTVLGYLTCLALLLNSGVTSA